METKTQTPVVTIRETDLFSVFCHALESGEFTQLHRMMWDRWNGRCALGVAATVLNRAGYGSADFAALHPKFLDINLRAGQLLGCGCIAGANDAGHSFKLIAAALRRARSDVEASNG